MSNVELSTKLNDHSGSFRREAVDLPRTRMSHVRVRQPEGAVHEVQQAASPLHPLPHRIPLGRLLRHRGNSADHLLSDHMSEGEQGVFYFRLFGLLGSPQR